jgi:hypothetical protein
MTTMTFGSIRQAPTAPEEDIQEMMDRDVCVLHDTVFMELKTAVSDIRWIARFGKWFLAVMGGTLLLTTGFTATLLTHIMVLNARVAVMEKQLIVSEKDRESLHSADSRIEDKLGQILDRLRRP